MANISIHALATLIIDTPDGDTPTMGHIREFVEKANQLNLPDDLELLDCVLAVEIPIKDLDVISCGQHVGKEPTDIVLYTHECDHEVSDPLWFEASDNIVKEMNPS
jgi:hypothetical protein